MTRRAFLSLRVLIIYNTTTGALLVNNTPFLRRAENGLFRTSQKIHEFPIDFNRSDFHQNSPREIHFYFCHRSAVICVRRVMFVVRLRWF